MVLLHTRPAENTQVVSVLVLWRAVWQPVDESKAWPGSVLLTLMCPTSSLLSHPRRSFLSRKFTQQTSVQHVVHVLTQEDKRQTAKGGLHTRRRINPVGLLGSLKKSKPNRKVSKFLLAHRCYIMLALFLASWFLFPQFMAKVETAKEDRITMELPTKWDEAPRGVILSALLGKVSLSNAWLAVAACTTDSMVLVLGGGLLLCSLGRRCLGLAVVTDWEQVWVVLWFLSWSLPQHPFINSPGTASNPSN